MIIEILNDNMKKLDILRKYTYVQYAEKSRSIGTFTVLAALVEENLYLLDRTRQYFILFENRVFGKIEKVKQSDDFEFEEVIEITGRLAKFILTKRVIDGTIKYKGSSAGYIKSLIEREFINTSDKKRRINLNVIYENEERLLSVCSNIDMQQTGGYVWDEIEKYLTQDKLILLIYPIIHDERIVDGVETNISNWNVIISAGNDKTQNNIQDNDVLIFSKSLSNISRVDYEKDVSGYCGVAYIAGEGEGAERKWYEKFREGEEQKSGWNRNELWIDARDIQSDKGTDEEGEEQGFLTDEEYEELINQRVDEKFVECELVESYLSTITRDKKRLIYLENVFLGDWCTVKDEQLGINIDAQVVGATITEQESQRIVDLEIEYGKIKKNGVDVINDLIQKVENQQSTIKYLVNSKNQTGGTIDDGDIENLAKDFMLKVYPVGSIYFTVNDVNPSEFFGGEWVVWGSGRVPVGVNTSDTNFNDVEKEGGVSAVTLTTNEIPSHNHTVGAHAHGLNNHTHSFSATTNSPTLKGTLRPLFWGSQSNKTNGILSAGDDNNKDRTASYGSNFGSGSLTVNATHSHTVTGTTGGSSGNTANSSSFNSGSAGSGNSHNNLQPYITCYMWKRIK